MALPSISRSLGNGDIRLLNYKSADEPLSPLRCQRRYGLLWIDGSGRGVGALHILSCGSLAGTLQHARVLATRLRWLRWALLRLRHGRCATIPASCSPTRSRAPSQSANRRPTDQDATQRTVVASAGCTSTPNSGDSSARRSSFLHYANNGCMCASRSSLCISSSVGRCVNRLAASRMRGRMFTSPAVFRKTPGRPSTQWTAVSMSP
jgi:hypothetical protein